jgi:hypothetical protein
MRRAAIKDKCIDEVSNLLLHPTAAASAHSRARQTKKKKKKKNKKKISRACDSPDYRFTLATQVAHMTSCM